MVEINKIFFYCFIFPLYILYFNGSTFWGDYGFWNGKEYFQICYEKTKVESSFWKNNVKECVNLIKNDFFSFVVMFYFIFILIFVCIGFKLFISYLNHKIIYEPHKLKIEKELMILKYKLKNKNKN